MLRSIVRLAPDGGALDNPDWHQRRTPARPVLADGALLDGEITATCPPALWWLSARYAAKRRTRIADTEKPFRPDALQSKAMSGTPRPVPSSLASKPSAGRE